MIVIELNVAVCMLEFYVLKSASPESLKHIYTNNKFLTLCHNKKHSHKNITFEIIISTSVSDKILATQNVQSCIVLDLARKKMLMCDG